MSDLLGGGPSASSGGPGRGTSNGGSRAPIPVPTQSPMQGVRGPREVMRDRQAREARKKAEGEAREREREEEERIRRTQDERRRSAERRAAAATSSSAAGVAGGGTGQGADTSVPRRTSGNPGPSSGDRRYQDRVASGSGSRANAQNVAQPPGQSSASARVQEPVTPSRAPVPGTGNGVTPSATAPGTRARRPSVSQGQPVPVQPQPYPETPSPYAQQQPSTQPRTRPVTGAPTSAQAQPGPSNPAPASQAPQTGPSTEGVSGRNPTVTSTFPHAFERWETLSSHWEGLTSYWIRRLEANREEVRREPLSQQMARQITDLSAAGANLFHAVVELQRLRASSERKFQRWFFETRAEQERAQEVQGELENTLRRERQERADAVAARARLEKEKANAEKLVAEMRRELLISKEEARRAWEELGRREQEERERTNSLREGLPTLVGGVQVVPMTQGVPSRQNSVNRPQDSYGAGPSRSTARDPASGGAVGPVAGTGSAAVYGGEYEYSDGGQTPGAEEGYRETGSHQLHHEPDMQALPRETYPATTTSTVAPEVSSSAAVQRAAAYAPQRQRTSAPNSSTVSAPTSAAAQYQQPIRTYAPDVPTSAAGTSYAPFYQHQGLSLGEQGAQLDETRSYSRPSETFSEEEYEIDESGNIRRDSQGNKIVYRRGLHSDDSEDEYNEDAEAREQAHTRHYGGGNLASAADYPPGATSTAGVGPGEPAWGYQDPAYTGAGYGFDYRHHHPTRLSDVQEEDERSRTSPSRASNASRQQEGSYR